MAAHSKIFSMSSSTRHLNCWASNAMSEGVEDEYSEPAERGTAVHECIEFCIKFNTSAYDCIGMTFNNFVIDQKMADGAQLFLVHARHLSETLRAELLSECRVYLRSIDDDVFGTADLILIAGEWLIVVDYKNGYEPVEVVENDQLKSYATATLETYNLWDQVKFVRTVIVQPNYAHTNGAIRHYDYPVEVMVNHYWRIHQAVTAMRSGEVLTPVAGEWCKYCRAQGCLARMRMTVEGLFHDRPMHRLDMDAVGKLLAMIPSMKRNLDNLEKYALSKAHGGHQFEDYKLVKSIVRYKCEDEAALIKDVEAEGIDKSVLYESTLKSKTKIDKAIPEHVLTKHFIKPPAGETLVRMSDSRPAIHKGKTLNFKPVD